MTFRSVVKLKKEEESKHKNKLKGFLPTEFLQDIFSQDLEGLQKSTCLQMVLSQRDFQRCS